MAEETTGQPPQPSATPSLKDIIAKQRAELAKKKAAAEQAQAAAEPAQAAAAPTPEVKPAGPADQAQPQLAPDAVDPRREDFIRAAKELGVDASEVDKLGPAELAMVQQMLDDNAKAAAKAAADSAKPAANAGSADAKAAIADLMYTVPQRKKVNLLHVMVMFNTAAVAMVLLGVFWLLPTYFKPASTTAGQVVYVTGAPQTLPATQQASQPIHAPENVAEVAPEVDPNLDVAASWRDAQNDYAQGKIGPALATYRKLLASIPPQAADQTFSRDFFRLRVAQCLVQLKQNARAVEHLQALSNSSSPIVRVVANYWLANIEVSSDQPMQARARALGATAVCGLLTDVDDLERDCQFLAAKALTVKTLSMYNAQANIDWGTPLAYDPFVNLSEQALRELLLQGSQRLAAATLGPQVKKTSTAGVSRYQAICSGSSLEDLLARMSAESGTSLVYINVPPSIRQHPVTLACTNWTEQRVYEAACGSVGLVVRFTGPEVQIISPAAAGSVTKERQIVLDECQAYWRRLLLRYSDDRRQALGNFVMAMVSEFAGDTLAAISQYEFTANHFAREKTAPEALLRCARLRMQIRDFAAAKTDLSNLLDNYSDFKSTDQAYLTLAQAMMEGGMVVEAGRTFNRIYQMEVPADVRVAACLGAAQCAFRQGQNVQAVKWIDQYLARQDQAKGPQLVEALTLLGRSQQALGKYTDAVGAYHLALAAQPADKERIEILLCLSDAQTRRESYTSALGALRQLESLDLTPAQQLESMTAMAKAYCGMGLPETAMEVLRHRLADLPDGQLKTLAGLELSRCARQAGRNQEAYDLLQAALDDLKGPQSLTASLELAELCLSLDKPKQALTMADGLLSSKDLDSGLAQRARAVSAKAHMAMGDYDKAALAVAGPATTQPGDQHQ